MSPRAKRWAADALGELWRAALWLVLTPALVVLAFLVLLAVAGFFTGFWGPLRYRELRQIEAKLEEIPGVRVVDTWGNEDITFEDIGATVEIEGKGRISFEDLTLAAFEPGGTRTFSVSRVGPHVFASCHTDVLPDGTMLDGSSFGSGIGLAPGGELAGHLPFTADRLQDVVTHYDALAAAVSSWPRYPSFLEVPCVAVKEDGTAVPCIRRLSKDGGLIPTTAITRLTVSERPVVLRACQARPITPEEERLQDRAIQSLQSGFKDRP